VTITDNSTGAAVDVTSALSSVVSMKATDVFDMREGRNVTITEIDVSKLKDLVGTGKTGFSKFNGMVYVNLKKGTASTPSAVRLIKATELPKSGDDGKGGFSLVTNGGLYVKGDYNTTTLSDGSTAKAMLMADAMTVLSADWNDANAANTDVTARKATKDLTINTAIMVGSTPASASQFSGGAQNLVRFLEDWSSTPDDPRTVTFKGSFGRSSTRRCSAALPAARTVYIQPKFRKYNFDRTCARRTGLRLGEETPHARGRSINGSTCPDRHAGLPTRDRRP
jgi:hypothetical protein